MKILATLLVRNEVELVAECLEHHLQQGVDAFLVTDHASTDDLAEVLHLYRHVIVDQQTEADARYLQNQWVTRMARHAVDFGPDWILHLDADERWSGLHLLKFVAPEYSWVKTGPWRNHLPLSESSGRMFRRETMPYFEIPGRTGSHAARFVNFGSGVGGKVIHRPMRDVVIGIGNHDLHSSDQPCFPCDGIQVHHYPIRSLAQFRNKVRIGAAALDAGDWAPGVGGHWRQWRDLDDDGKLADVFRTFLLTESEIQMRLADGTLFHERTLP